MNNSIIRINNIGKQYRVGEKFTYGSLRDDITNFFKNGFGKIASPAKDSPLSEAEKQDYFWSLKDVTFDIKSGEIVGIIGRNGAGKSTLLKLIAGITQPTEGRIDIYGRIGSLLEVGTGFHPELTGKENIFLNGAILGMRRREIERKFDEIVAFSEVEKFVDTPVKYYSTGMRIRLGFSIAAHLEPEILLIDEVLAVGDAAFQKKCLGKLDNVATSEGRTVLFVSHDMTAIVSLCSNAIYLDRGRVISKGPTGQVVEQYLSTVVSDSNTSLEDREDRSGDGTVRITSLKIENNDTNNPIRTGCKLKFELKYRSSKDLTNPQIVFKVKDFSTDANIVRLDSDIMSPLPEVLPSTGTVTCVTEELYISPGRCSVEVLIKKGQIISDEIRHATTFDIEIDDVYGSGKMPRRDQSAYLVKYNFTAEG